MMRIAWGVLALAIGLGALTHGAAAGTGAKTVLVSRQSQAAGGAGANASSQFPKVSASGRFVAFTSEATNLGGDTSNDVNAFLYDRKRKRLELISRQSKSAGGDPANGDSFVDGISANGRFVVFGTNADNLGGPIAGGVSNVYVYDRKQHRVELISRQGKGAGGAGADGSSFDASISADGRLVAFTTQGDNLGGPVNDVSNVYVYDRERKRQELVSRRSKRADGLGGDGDSERPAISASGRVVAFESEADNLGGPIEDHDNIYAYDRKAKRVQLVSRRGSAGADDDSSDPAISGAGRFVAFRTFSGNLGGPAKDVPNIYLYDRRRERIELISRRSGKPGKGADDVSYHAAISGGGRFVAFDTEAQNLGGNPVALQNIYLYDRERRRVELVSRGGGTGGPPADQNSVNPSISPSGRFVAFDSQADNLPGPAAGFPFTSSYLRDRG